MKRFFLLALFLVFFIPGAAFGKDAGESDAELKTYLSDMNRVFIEIEETIRNFGIKMMPPNVASKQITEGIKKFKELKAPSLFSKDHGLMLSAFESIRDGMQLLSEGEREKSVTLVRGGASALKEAAINIRTIAEKRSLIPPRPVDNKPILPPQAASPILGVTPTPSPHIASPGVDDSVMVGDATSSAQMINLSGIKDAPGLPQVPASNAVVFKGENLSSPFTMTGEIVSVKPQGNSFLVTLKDNLGAAQSVDINPQQCSVIKDSKIVSADEIKKGNFCHVLYAEDGGRNQAAFMVILKPEEVDKKIIFTEQGSKSSPE